MNVEIYHVLLNLDMVGLCFILNLYNKRASPQANSTSSLANFRYFTSSEIDCESTPRKRR
jgi:hypothetical protein